MKKEQFDEVIEKQLETAHELLCSKNAGYATEDKLHNFRVAASLRGCTMEQALGGMLSKHTVSLYDMIESREEYPLDKWDEKILDHINYLLILKAILVEREGLKARVYADYGRPDSDSEETYKSAKKAFVAYNHSYHIESEDEIIERLKRNEAIRRGNREVLEGKKNQQETPSEAILSFTFDFNGSDEPTVVIQDGHKIKRVIHGDQAAFIFKEVKTFIDTLK